MSKVAVVYWSGTGNTEQMAESVADGARNAGADVTTFTAAEFDADKMDEFDAIAFGCPSMGAEQLEEDEFEPMMLVEAIRELNEAIGIPADLTTAIKNAAKGQEVTEKDILSKIDAMADDAMKSGNIAVNPRASRKQDIVELYHKAL